MEAASFVERIAMSRPPSRPATVAARMVVCLAIGSALLVPGAAGADTPDPAIPLMDTVTATGSGAGFVNIDVSAQSGPSGESPAGTASTTIMIEDPRPQLITLSGPVTCLAVSGNTAVLNFTDTTFGLGSLTLGFTDNGGGGRDLVSAGALRRAPTDCSPLPSAPLPLTAGRAVVVDAQPPPTSRKQCRHGGYLRFGFKTRKECFRFVQHHR
jgi:hypothetical protein